MKRLLSALTSIILINSASADTIFVHGLFGGKTIHQVKFTTHVNSPIDAQVRVQVGQWANQACVVQYSKDLGNFSISDGEVVSVDSFKVKWGLGGGYTCTNNIYTYKGKQVVDTYQVKWDGSDYTSSVPFMSYVNLS